MEDSGDWSRVVGMLGGIVGCCFVIGAKTDLNVGCGEGDAGSSRFNAVGFYATRTTHYPFPRNLDCGAWRWIKTRAVINEVSASIYELRLTLEFNIFVIRNKHALFELEVLASQGAYRATIIAIVKALKGPLHVGFLIKHMTIIVHSIS